MAYDIDWLIENEVIFVRYHDSINVDELKESMQVILALTEASSRQLVHTIIDSRDLKENLKPLDAMRATREVRPHVRAGWTCAILPQYAPLLELAVNMATSVVKLRYRITATFEEAQVFLEEMDTTLHWEYANRALLTKE